MKTKLLVFLFALTMQFVNAQLNFKVLNIDGNPQEGVEVSLYDSGWGDIAGSPFTTAGDGVAVVNGLADGDYYYVINYTATDGVKSQWGWGATAVAGTTDFEVTQNYPLHSGDNLSSLSLNVGSSSTIDFNVTNSDVNGDEINTLIEVWISKDKNETDFHFTMTEEELVAIASGNSHTFNLDFTPSVDGEYFWKAVVYANGRNGLFATDSFDWTSAFVVGNVDQLNFKVLNSDGNPQEGVEITLFDADWNLVDGSPFTTGAGGIAGILGLADGNYHYEIYHTETDGVKSFWGWGMNIVVAGTTDFEVTQNYPHYSGDNLSSLTLETGVASSIDFMVTNNDVNGDDNSALIEVWISETKSESDFHYTMTVGELVEIVNGTEHTFNFDFTPPNDGAYFWKAKVLMNGTTVTDSFDWTSAFTVGPLKFEVLNGAGNPQEGVEITFYQPGWGAAETYYTAANGIAEIPATSGNAVYQYEINYTGTDGIRNAWGWGNADFSGGNNFQVAQNYPFYSGDNIADLTFQVETESTINFNVSNNAPGEDIWTAIEVWISKTKSEGDFHYTMDGTEWLGTGTELSFPFNFTPIESGEYFWKAIVHYNNPTGTPTSDSFDWTSAFTVGTLGVDNFTLNNTISVFPNPIVDSKVRFNLSTNDFINGEVILYDLTGRAIVSKKINQNTGELNVVGLSEGLYFMKFINEDKIATQKVIIK